MKQWWNEPITVIQTNLQVADTPRLDANRLMYQLKRELKADVVVFNAAGIYAWYPSKVPFHNINPFMGDRDVLHEAIEAAHREGMRLIARTSIGHAEEWIYHQHPDWFIKDENGNPNLVGEPRPGNWGLLYSTCPNAPYQREAVAYKMYEEILAEYDVDGFFITFMGFPRSCYCSYCRRKYRKEMGKELPVNIRPGSPDWLEYTAWQTHCSIEVFRTIAELIRSKRPGILITGEFGGTCHTPYELCQICDVLSPNVTDRVGDQQPPRWATGVETRYARTVSNGVAPWTIVAPAPGLIWRHASLPENELRYWMSQIPANGGHMWHALTGIPDTQKDRRLLKVIAEIDERFDAFKPYLRDAEPVAPVAVLESRQTLLRYGLDHPAERYLNEVYGFYDALTSGHIQFTPIPDEHLTDDHLKHYKVLVLPNSACLTQEQIEAIRRFAQGGGGLIGSYRVSLHDSAGNEQEDFALSDEFGVKFIGNEISNLVAAYMRVEDKWNPLLTGIGETNLIPHETSLLQVIPYRGDIPLKHVPPFATREGVGAPPERASLPTPRTDIPVAVCQDNVSRRVYFASRIGSLVWRWKLPDHRLLIANAVRWVLGENNPIETNAPYGIHISLFASQSYLIIHYVNMIGERPLSEIIPVRDVKVCVKVPDGTEIETVFTASSGRKLEFQVSDGRVDFRVPEIGYWDVTVIQLKAK